MIRSLAVLPALTLIYAAGTAQIVYVDDSATGANDGTSWPNAFVHLQDALAIVQPTQEVWVAAGTYRPDQSSSPLNPTPPVPGSRTESFVLTSCVAVYGGFLGTETTLAERAQLFDQTVLSGDLQGDDGPGFANYGDNSYHVVDASGSGATDVLDGFLVVGGNATGPALGSFDRGGGLISRRRCSDRELRVPPQPGGLRGGHQQPRRRAVGRELQLPGQPGGQIRGCRPHQFGQPHDAHQLPVQWKRRGDEWRRAVRDELQQAGGPAVLLQRE